nr:cupin domain-containing protein [Gammaproteobacteria bacterium]
MSIIEPEIEKVDRSTRSIRYLQHGWPSELCRWHAHEEYELHLVVETRGKAFVGDYIGDFKAGDLYMTGPNLPHNWITDQVWSEPVDIRDMLIQFSHESVEQLAAGFPEFSQVLQMLQLAQSGIYFEGFNPTFARGHMESIRDNQGAERILAFVRFLVRLNEHAEKKTLSISKLIQPEGGSKQARIAQVVDYITRNYYEVISVAQA